MWKDALLDFAKQFDHPAWGLSHSERVYELALELAEAEGAEIDQDALLAAAYLHDTGALEPYREKDVDHAERSAHVAKEILPDLGFPEDKLALVNDIILHHMFSVEPTDRIETVLFRDADTLDFMGAIGIARMLSVVGLDNWTPDVKTAITLIRRFNRELPGKLRTTHAQDLGQARQAEATSFLTALSDETAKFKVL
jgi:HD superfamily phosphodiesterase